MIAYLFVDVDDLLAHAQGSKVDWQELAVAMRANAIMVAGLYESTMLKAVAFANWDSHSKSLPKEPYAIFQSAGYETCDISDPQRVNDLLLAEYFPPGHAPPRWLILASTSPDRLELLSRINLSVDTQFRLWGIDEDALEGVHGRERFVVQRLDSLVGIQRIKNVAVYIDFENISISLNEQGFVVNLDHLIDRMVSQAQAHGQLVKTAAYAPWGQRGALPPLVDGTGQRSRRRSPGAFDESQYRPGLPTCPASKAPISASPGMSWLTPNTPSREMSSFSPLATATSTMSSTRCCKSAKRWLSGACAAAPADCCKSTRPCGWITSTTSPKWQTHESLGDVETERDTESFTPSQWSSVIIQFFRMSAAKPQQDLTIDDLIAQLSSVGDVISSERGG